MANDNDKNRPATDLRRTAEERLRSQTAELNPAWTREEMLKLVHELEVHQIELEMQNEELRQARDKLENALEKYTDLYDFAPIGYFTLDRSGVIRAVNLSGAHLLGIERSRLIGRRFDLIIADDDRPLFSDFLDKVFAGQGKENCEATLTRAKNHRIFSHIEAIAFSSGQECRVAVIDISPRKAAEDEILMLNANLATKSADLEDANQELAAFNYTVAHDLRQPLNLISSYCQMIKGLCGNTIVEKCSMYLQETYESIQRMSRLIEALLDFSRVGLVEPQRDRIDLGTLAHEVITTLKRAEPGRQIVFHCPERIPAHADVNLLRVVLENLLGNAWKYSSLREETVIVFGSRTAIDGNTIYYVRDNGKGFNMIDVKKFFVPLQRFPDAEKSGAFGIGRLATAARIIRLHGGRIWAEGEPGKGAAFYFTLPEKEQ